MSDATLAAEVSADLLEAYYAERNGDLAEALRLYRLAWHGMAHLKETENERLRMEFGDLKPIIEDLEKQIAAVGGGAKCKRIPIQHVSPGCSDYDIYGPCC